MRHEEWTQQTVTKMATQSNASFCHYNGTHSQHMVHIQLPANTQKTNENDIWQITAAENQYTGQHLLSRALWPAKLSITVTCRPRYLLWAVITV